MSGFWAAFRFLTFLPVPRDWGASSEALARSKPWFPVVGLAIGGAAAALSLLLDPVLPRTVVSVLLVAFLIAVSRGLHADGLADTADGFFSSRSRDRILDIMRDSRIGTMGVLALVFTILVKISCFDALPAHQRVGALLLAPLAGRHAMIQMLASLPYTRESGLGGIFYERSPGPALAVSLLTLAGVGWVLFGGAGLWLAGAVCGIAHLAVMKCRSVIGGATGDTLGATCEIVEAATWLGLPPVTALISGLLFTQPY